MKVASCNFEYEENFILKAVVVQSILASVPAGIASMDFSSAMLGRSDSERMMSATASSPSSTPAACPSSAASTLMT